MFLFSGQDRIACVHLAKERKTEYPTSVHKDPGTLVMTRERRQGEEMEKMELILLVLARFCSNSVNREILHRHSSAHFQAAPAN